MTQLIMKNLLRALLIFLPVGLLTFARDSQIGQSVGTIPESAGLVVLILFSIVVMLVLWARR